MCRSVSVYVDLFTFLYMVRIRYMSTYKFVCAGFCSGFKRLSDSLCFVCAGLSPDLQSMEQIRRIMRPTDVPDTGLLFASGGGRGWTAYGVVNTLSGCEMDGV